MPCIFLYPIFLSKSQGEFLFPGETRSFPLAVVIQCLFHKHLLKGCYAMGTEQGSVSRGGCVIPLLPGCLVCLDVYITLVAAA